MDYLPRGGVVPSPMPSPEVNPVSSRGPGVVYEFRDFRLGCGRLELLRDSRPRRVERKPMDLLILLVSREGQLVTRAEIAGRLWSSQVFVDTEHGINTAIGKLRHLLRDDPEDPHFIHTVTGIGYRFVAPVSQVAAVSTPAPVLPPEDMPDPAAAVAPRSRRKLVGWYVGAGAGVVLALGSLTIYRSRHRPPEVRYTQLT